MGFLTKIFQKKQGETITKADYAPKDLYLDHKQIQEALTDIQETSQALSQIETLNNEIALKAQELAAEYLKNATAVKDVKEKLTRLNFAIQEIDADIGTITKISAKADSAMSLENEINPYVSHIIDVMQENDIGTMETYISLREQIANRRQDLLRAFYPKGYEQIQKGTSQTIVDYGSRFYASNMPGSLSLQDNSMMQYQIQSRENLADTLDAAITYAKEQTKSLEDFLQGKTDNASIQKTGYVDLDEKNDPGDYSDLNDLD